MENDKKKKKKRKLIQENALTQANAQPTEPKNQTVTEGMIQWHLTPRFQHILSDFKSLSVRTLSTQQNLCPSDLPSGAAKAHLEDHIFKLTLHLFWTCSAATAMKTQAPHIHICLQLHGQIPFDCTVPQRAFPVNVKRCKKSHTGHYIKVCLPTGQPCWKRKSPHHSMEAAYIIMVMLQVSIIITLSSYKHTETQTESSSRNYLLLFCCHCLSFQQLTPSAFPAWLTVPSPPPL